MLQFDLFLVKCIRSRARMSIYVKELHILPVKCRIYFKIALLTFKCLSGLAPQ